MDRQTEKRNRDESDRREALVVRRRSRTAGIWRSRAGAGIDSCRPRRRTRRPDETNHASGLPPKPRLGVPAGLVGSGQTRLTNGFSRKLENHAAATAIHFMHYNFARIHRTVRMSPAMAAGVTETLWTVRDIVGLLEERERERRHEHQPFEPALFRDGRIMSVWTRDELILALDLYQRSGVLWSTDPDVNRLSAEIGRSPGAVSMRLANYRHLDRSAPGKGLTDGGTSTGAHAGSHLFAATYET